MYAHDSNGQVTNLLAAQWPNEQGYVGTYWAHSVEHDVFETPIDGWPLRVILHRVKGWSDHREHVTVLRDGTPLAFTHNAE